MAAMEQLIAIINKLQDVFAVLGSPSTIDLPQIVVIGAYAPAARRDARPTLTVARLTPGPAAAAVAAPCLPVRAAASRPCWRTLSAATFSRAAPAL